VTRRERRFLLGLAVLAFALTSTGLVPTEIAALGVRFAHAERRALLWVLAMVLAFALTAFLVYASSDFVAWRIDQIDALRKWFRSNTGEDASPSLNYDLLQQRLDEQEEHFLRLRVPRHALYTRLAPLSSWTRAFLEFAAPVLIAAYALFVVTRGAYSLPAQNPQAEGAVPSPERSIHTPEQ